MTTLYDRTERFNARCNEIISQIDILKSVSEPLKYVAINPHEKRNIPNAIDQLRNQVNSISKELHKFRRSYYRYYSDKALKEQGAYDVSL